MGADPEVDAFAEELAAMKRRGCNLLVVDPPGDSTLCDELLGDPAEPRCRIVVDSGSGRHEDPPEDRVVIELADRHTRSAAASVQDRNPRDRAREGCDNPPDLDDLRTRIETAIGRFEHEGLEPGELRLCLGDLPQIAVGIEEDRVSDFLEGVTDAVREVNGMGHVHVTPDTATQDRIESAFDVTIDLQSTPAGRHYRWHLHDAGLDSGWLVLD